jgi:hypothetical protein
MVWPEDHVLSVAVNLIILHTGYYFANVVVAVVIAIQLHIG